MLSFGFWPYIECACFFKLTVCLKYWEQTRALLGFLRNKSISVVGFKRVSWRRIFVSFTNQSFITNSIQCTHKATLVMKLCPLTSLLARLKKEIVNTCFIIIIMITMITVTTLIITILILIIITITMTTPCPAGGVPGRLPEPPPPVPGQGCLLPHGHPGKSWVGLPGYRSLSCHAVIIPRCHYVMFFNSVVVSWFVVSGCRGVLISSCHRFMFIIVQYINIVHIIICTTSISSLSRDLPPPGLPVGSTTQLSG